MEKLPVKRVFDEFKEPQKWKLPAISHIPFYDIHEKHPSNQFLPLDEDRWAFLQSSCQMFNLCESLW